MLITPELATKLFLYCGIIGTIVFFLKTFIPVEFGPEVDGDFTSVTDTDASIQYFSIESISAFFMCSGWISYLAFNHLDYSLRKSAVLGVIFGVIGMYLFAWLIFQFKKLEKVTKVDYNTLLNKTGKAYMAFKPKGNGKIQIEINEKLDTLDAINESEEEINSFDEIKVVKVENNQIYIRKVNS